ncbi:hypothetical protein VTO42DRAFT_80 [Malbranchea cinnamomea]
MSAAPQTPSPQVGKLVNVIPVGLKEAALDSPSFRASTLHFFEQIDLVEKWLDGYVKATGKLASELSTLENVSNNFLSHIAPLTNISEAVLDHDYALLAQKRYSDCAKDFWSGAISTLRKLETVVLEPIRSFINGDLRAFKELRRTLEQTQKQYDNVHARYASQTKTKEPSSLREDAFQLHEARKAYLKASMDFCVQSPQIKLTLEKLLVDLSYGQWRDFKIIRDGWSLTFTKFGPEMDRIKGWTHELENTEKSSRRELLNARKQIEEAAEQAARPSRELDDYSVSTVPYLGSKGPASLKMGGRAFGPEKQGWLNLRFFTGRPSRPVWVRRWAFLKNGIFGCLVQGSRTGGVEESERIGVLLCSVRPAFQEERRFCFEVKTKSNSIMLQAETQKELMEWIGAFEAAKRKALESPQSEWQPAGKLPAHDPAFSISQPPVPEFTADPSDSLTPNANDEQSNGERSSTLPLLDRDGLAVRNSGDFSSLRRSTALDRETDGGRDHASRIIQKFDIHRKSNASSQPPVSPQIGATATASLVSTSNMALPLSAGPLPEVDGKAQALYPSRDSATSSLAPLTLVSPPTPTAMSRAAVIVCCERGIGIGPSDSTGVVPSGMMANLWGSTHWGLINKLRREERLPASSPDDSSDSTQARVLSEELRADTRSPQSRSPASRHRQTVSLGGDTDSLLTEAPATSYEYPSCYPQQLKAHDAQFRLLFPDVSRDETLVLVFRATFSPNDQQEFPGRAYTTTRNIYFYSNYSGLVLTSCASLSSISEVTAAPGRDCDFLFLHVLPEKGSDVPGRLTVKTFLEPLKLLQKRLNFLVNKASSGQPVNLESVIKALLRMELDVPTRTPSMDSWEDLALNTPADDKTVWGGPSVRHHKVLQHGLYVDKDFRLDQNKSGVGSEVSKFKLPAQPVEYVPRGSPHLVAEKFFNISPKALFHVLFGDKSPVWQQLQLQRRAQDIRQGPWKTLQSGTKTRNFEYSMETTDVLGKRRLTEVSDYQIVDVLNDHLCYVVTDKRTPWHLPYKQDFSLVTKIVITHVAKSRCKLAVFTKVEWQREPYLIKRIIEKRAMDDLEQDAFDLVDIATEQTRRLGPRPQTKTALSMFGHLGRLSQVIQYAGGTPALGSHRRRPKRSGLLPLLLETFGSLLQSAVSSLMIWFWAGLRWVFKTCDANRTIMLVLFLSLIVNGVHLYHGALEMWNDRKASDFMSRLGVRPDEALAKVIYIKDLDEAIAPVSDTAANRSSTCFSIFQENNSLDTPDAAPLTTLDHDSATKTAGFRFQRTRQRLATYRHDLLVALRLVNRVEKEVIQAEWERWVLQESRRCQMLGNLLNASDQDSEDDITSEIKSQFAGRTDVEQWYQDYCMSCQKEKERIANPTV